MNAGEIAKRGWELGGEDSRYDGDDLTTSGGVALLAKTNQAYRFIASYKFPRIGVIPFRGLENEVFFTAKNASDVVSAGTSTTVFDITSGNVALHDVVTIGSESRVVVALSGTTVTVAPAFTTAPAAADAITVRAQRYSLSSDLAISARTLIDIVEIYDKTNENEVFRADGVHYFEYNADEPGVPEQYTRFGNDVLVFSQPPEGAYTYLVKYAGMPSELTVAADETVLPESFHEVVAMRVGFLLKLQQEDFEGAYRLKQNYEQDLRSLQTEYEPFWDGEVGRIILQ